MSITQAISKFTDLNLPRSQYDLKYFSSRRSHGTATTDGAALLIGNGQHEASCTLAEGRQPSLAVLCVLIVYRVVAHFRHHNFNRWYNHFQV
jgi:hypothetical protein